LSKRNRQLERIASRQVTAALQVTQYSGPLPHPDALERYNQICPGAAERIIAQFENQALHRQSLEVKVVHSNTFCQKLGSVSALILGLAGICGGIYLVHAGQSTPGLATFFTSLCSLIGVFIYGRESQKKELGDKRG
jgi:uncharacterized membrane protein